MAHFNTTIYTWIDYWFQDHEIRKDVYKIIKEIVISSGKYNREHEIIDRLLPYICEFESHDFLFKFICNYYVSIFGWNSGWTSKKYTINIWKILKNNFPNRYEEFLIKTIGKDPFDKINNFKYFLPIPRIIEFFVYFNNLNTAEKMIDETISFANDLIGNLNLKIPKWMKVHPPDLYELLLSRLKWPSPIVRERSASAIADLLKNDKDIFTKLIDWLSRQQLESTTILGLIPIAKYARRNKKQFRLNINEIFKAIKKPSIITTRLLQEISENINNNSIEIENLEKPPYNYAVDKFFIKYAKNFIPPVFFDNAENFEKKYLINFVSHWSWEFENLIINQNINKVSDTYYQGYMYEPKLLGFSSKISEVYKSSYLRTLAYYFKENGIPRWLYYKKSYELCPIDLALWELEQKTPPKWWPKYNSSTSKDDFDIKTSSAIPSIDEFINKQCLNNKSNMLLLAANGAIQPKEGWVQNKMISDFTILGFAYRILGPNIPKDKDIIDLLKWKPIWMPIPNVDKPLSFLDDPHHQISIPEKNILNIQDLEIIPLVALIKTNTINFWQWHRYYHLNGIFGLSNFLYSKKVKFKKQKYSLNYTCSDSHTNIAKGKLFNMGIIERVIDHNPIPAGQYIHISKEWLYSVLKENELKLGFISELRFNIKKYSYEESNIYKVYKSYGIIPLII